MPESVSKTVSVFGLGYVGCVSLGCLAKAGHKVIGVDINAEKVSQVNAGIPTIVEPGLDELFREGHAAGTITATADVDYAVRSSSILLITVGTPSAPDGELDLGQIHAVAAAIARSMEKTDAYHVIAIRSTIKPGTCEHVTDIIEKNSSKRRGQDFSVVANPEFLREGSAIKDYQNPPYVLIGAHDARGAEKLASIYATVNAQTIRVDLSTAEIIKYVNNSWHALKVAFGNEVGAICKSLGIGSAEVIETFLQDRVLNISPMYLRPGFAYGGACLPKDLSALVALARANGVVAPVLENVSTSNHAHIQRAIDLIRKQGVKRLGFLGVSFKSGTDDVRNSPVLDVIAALTDDGYDIRIFDDTVSFSLENGRSSGLLRGHLGPVADLLVKTGGELMAHAECVVVAKKDRTFDTLLEKLDGRSLVDLVFMGEAAAKKGAYVGLSW